MKLPHLIFLLSVLAGSGLIVGGVYVLLGTGWALLASGVALLMFAGFLRRGLTGG